MDAQTNKLMWATIVGLIIGASTMTILTYAAGFERTLAGATGLIIGMQSYFYILLAGQYRILKKTEVG